MEGKLATSGLSEETMGLMGNGKFNFAVTLAIRTINHSLGCFTDRVASCWNNSVMSDH